MRCSRGDQNAHGKGGGGEGTQTEDGDGGGGSARAQRRRLTPVSLTPVSFAHDAADAVGEPLHSSLSRSYRSVSPGIGLFQVSCLGWD